MSTEKRAREGWIEVSCEGTDSEGRSFFQCDMYVEPVAGLTHVREVIDGDADLWRVSLTRQEQNKLIERTCKRDAAMDILQWAGVRLSKSDRAPNEIEHGSALWFALEKYENHKKFCDEHTHYYDYATSQILPKERP